MQEEEPTFESLGVCQQLVHACERLKYSRPTAIQSLSLPHTLKGKDLIALAQTGSGKTLAFALPVVQYLLEKPQSFTALVMSPTRELCIQISEHLQALGAGLGLKTSVVVGGIDTGLQVKSLNNKPHVVIGTPGKVLFHIQNTKSFRTENIKFLIFDEADKLLSMDFERQINRLLEALPRNRQTLLFSATMTNKVEKLERASLCDPVRVQAARKFELVEGLCQLYCLLPARQKDYYLYHVLLENAGSECIVFVTTCMGAIRVCLTLRKLGIKTGTINGKITQPKRIAALNRFRAKEDQVLVATDVASRGLDIPTVSLVINYDLPLNPKDYVHRVGRTARAGRAGKSVTFVCQYDAEQFLKIQQLTATKMEEYKTREEVVLSRQREVDEARRAATEDLHLKLQRRREAGLRETRDKSGATKKIKKRKGGKSLLEV